MGRFKYLQQCVREVGMKRACLVEVVCSLAFQVLATTYHVDASRPDDSGSGLSWATAFKTLQTAVDVTVAGDTVLVADGVYDVGGRPVPGYSLSNRVYISKAIHLRSVNGPDETFIVGAPATGGGCGPDAVRGAFVTAVSATITGFTFTNGHTADSGIFYNSCGGGICSENFSAIIVSNCVFTANSAYAGGGFSGFGTIRDSRFVNNHALDYGGALYGSATAYDCVFLANTSAKYGGAVSDSTVHRCAFEGNHAGQFGGGMHNGVANDSVFIGNTATWYGGGKSYASANNCRFEANTAAYGGGAYELIATLCTFVGNTATLYGGGTFDGQADRCTFTGNKASQHGGGMFAYAAGDPGAGWASHCVFSGNVAGLSGGGMYQGTATRCQFLRNLANDGGATRLTVARNSLYALNTARFSGGGLHSGSASNCTLSGNSAGTHGGGAYQGTLNNCIVWYNSAAEGGDDLHGVAAANHTCSPDVEHGVAGCITDEPMLISSSHISIGSPCRAAGSTVYSTGTDLDGDAWQSPPSIGCDEPDGLFDSPLTVGLRALPERLMVGRNIVVQAMVVGEASAFKLDFGDGTVVWNDLAPILHAWQTGGTYEVRLIAYNEAYPDGLVAVHSLSVATALEATIHVAPDGDDDNDGASWATAKATLQAAVDAQAYPGGPVVVADGTYLLTEEIVVDKEVLIQSLNGPEVTVIDGSGITRCFHLGSSPTLLSGFTIRNGYGRNIDGAGVYCTDETPVISNCRITDNVLEGYGSGSGMYGGTARRCVFSGNQTPRSGGGLACGRAESCLFVGNSAGYYGGGAYDSTLVNCTLAGNHSDDYGGAASNATLVNSIAWYNTAPTGDNLYDCVATYTCSPDVTHGAGGCITGEPFFADRSRHDYRLEPASPCIDAGFNDAVESAFDLAGNPRILYGTVDLGACEWVAPLYWIATSTQHIAVPVPVGETPANVLIEIWNAGTSTMDYSIQKDVDWLTVTPDGGSSSGGERDVLTIELDTTGLDVGVYTGMLTITSPQASNSPRAIDVVATVYVPVLDRFEWSSWRSTQSEGTPISASITARDAHGYRVSSFAGSVQLAGLVPGATAEGVTIGVDSGTWNYPMSTYYYDARTQVIYLASELGGARAIHSLSLDVATVPGQTLENWTVRMRHTPLSSYPSSGNWETDWTTVFQGDVTVASPGWCRFEFDTPFEYNGTDNLMVDFSHNNDSYSSDGSCRNHWASAARSLYFRTDNGYGDPLDWAGSSDPTPAATDRVPNIRLETFVPAPVAISPAGTEPFVAGVWSGAVTVLEPADSMVLLADDQVGHRGWSRPFNTLADTDGDGLPNDWEIRHFGDATVAVPGAMAANGVNTVFQCYIADLDPFGDSVFAITGFDEGDVGFLSSGSRMYSLLLRASLSEGAWTTLEGPRPGVDGPDSMSGPVEASGGYLRLKVELP